MILNLIKELSNNDDQSSIICTVKSVDEGKNTCDVSPINGNADLLDVRLRASVTDLEGVIYIPTIGSDVIVTYLEGQGQSFVTMMSTIDKVVWKIKDKIMTLDNNGLKIKGNTSDFAEEVLNLYDIVSDLTTEILNLKVLTAVGSSTGLMPDNITNLTKSKIKLATSKNKISKIIN